MHRPVLAPTTGHRGIRSLGFKRWFVYLVLIHPLSNLWDSPFLLCSGPAFHVKRSEEALKHPPQITVFSSSVEIPTFGDVQLPAGSFPSGRESIPPTPLPRGASSSACLGLASAVPRPKPAPLPPCLTLSGCHPICQARIQESSHNCVFLIFCICLARSRVNSTASLKSLPSPHSRWRVPLWSPHRLSSRLPLLPLNGLSSVCPSPHCPGGCSPKCRSDPRQSPA